MRKDLKRPINGPFFSSNKTIFDYYLSFSLNISKSQWEFMPNNKNLKTYSSTQKSRKSGIPFLLIN